MTPTVTKLRDGSYRVAHVPHFSWLISKDGVHLRVVESNEGWSASNAEAMRAFELIVSAYVMGTVQYEVTEPTMPVRTPSERGSRYVQMYDDGYRAGWLEGRDNG